MMTTSCDFFSFCDSVICFLRSLSFPRAPCGAGSSLLPTRVPLCSTLAHLLSLVQTHILDCPVTDESMSYYLIWSTYICSGSVASLSFTQTLHLRHIQL